MSDSIKNRAQASGPSDLGVTIHIETTPDRARVWTRYFESRGLTDTGATAVGSGVVEYRYETRAVVVRRILLRVGIER